MTTTEARSALTELADLARARGWAEVSAFLGSFATADDRGIAVLAGERADAGPLLTWTAALDGAPELRPGSLSVDGDDDGATTLAPRRALVVLRCATPLRPTEVTALRTLRLRPAGSYLIAFVGAEMAGTEDELDLLERGIRRSVPTVPADAAHGPLAERGIALWAAGDPAGPVTARLAADRARIAEWVSGDPADDTGELDRVRARHAVTMAHAALAAMAARRERREPDAGSVRLQRLHSRLLQIHSAVLARLDAEVALLQSDIEVSFAAVRQEIVDSTVELVRTAPADRFDRVGQRVEERVTLLLHRWKDQRAGEIRHAGAETVVGGVERLLQGDLVDWDVANGLSVLPPGASYPRHLLEPIADLARLPAPPPGATRTGRLDPSRSGSLPTTAFATVGALVGAGTPVGPLGGLALGLVAAEAWKHKDEAERRRKLSEAAVTWARNNVNDYGFALRRAQTDQVQWVGEEVHRRLGELETALLEHSAGRADDHATSPVDDEDTTASAALTALQTRLGA